MTGLNLIKVVNQKQKHAGSKSEINVFNSLSTTLLKQRVSFTVGELSGFITLNIVVFRVN